MKKRLLCVVLVFAIMMSLVPAAVFAQEQNATSVKVKNPFADVKESDWYYESVMYVYVNNLFNGTSKHTFDPDGTMTRGMFVTVLGRMAGVHIADYSGTVTFDDVPEDAYYAPYVAWASRHGITTGTGENTFSPDDLINRQQMAAFFVRYFDAFGVNCDTGANITTVPADLDSVADYAKEAVLRLWKYGLLNGNGTDFDPTANATRAQTAALCTRTDAAVSIWYREPGIPSDRVRIQPDFSDDSQAVTPDTPAVDPQPSDPTEDGSSGDDGESSGASSGICKVSFYHGNSLIDDIDVPYGSAPNWVPDVEDSSRKGYILTGYYLDRSCTQPFYASEPVYTDLEVFAGYHKMDDPETLNLTTFTQMDAEPTLSFQIHRVSGNVEPQHAATLEVKDGSDPVNLTVSGPNSHQYYTVSAVNGFNPGCSYELTLADGWTFRNKPETVRTASFSIFKEEVTNLQKQMRDDIIYIKDTDEIFYNVDTQTSPVPVLNSDMLSHNTNAPSDTPVTGSLNISGVNAEIGDILCIYVNKHPVTERKADLDFLDPAVYVEVSNVTDSAIYFKTLNQESQKKLYEIPDNFPIELSTHDLTGSADINSFVLTGSTNINALDVPMYQALLGLDAAPDASRALQVPETPEERDETLGRARKVINVGDFLTFYFDGIDSVDDLRYGRITAYDETTGDITYTEVSRQTLLECMDLYSDIDIPGDHLVTDEEKEQIEATLQEQLDNSDFPEEAAYLLADMVTKTDGFRENMTVEDYLLTDENGEPVSDETLELLGSGASFVLNYVTVVPQLITKGDKLHFGDGVQLSIEVDAGFEVEVEDGIIAIDLSASFIQEVTLDPRVNGYLVYKEILFIPIPVGVHVGASIDIKSYTALSFNAEIYTIKQGDANLWNQIKDIARSQQPITKLSYLPAELTQDIETVGDIVDAIDILSNTIAQRKNDRMTLWKYENDLECLWQLLEYNGVNRHTYSYICNRLGKTSVSSDMMNMMETADRNGLNYQYQATLDQLLERYSELLSRETDWVKIVEQNIVTAEVNAYGLCAGVEIDFVVRADMNISIGSNLEYEVGKRYSFWFEIGLFKPTAGSSTMDLIDEQFAFQFYVMGKLGVRAGISAKVYVGIGSGKIASVGIAAEMGPYVKLHGFYIYEYTRYRAKNTQNWVSSERMEGALHLEFGLYFILSFEAEALGLFEYTHEFLNEEIPLLEAGNNRFYYGFDYDPAYDEAIYIFGETKLDQSLLALAYIDLITGRRGSDVRSFENYNFSLSNPKFSIRYDPNWAVPVVDVEVPENTRFMTCDLTITYMGAKMPFSDYDMTVTIPLVWTNLTNRELKEYYTASVKVGNEQDGYQTVWTKQVLKGQPFDLPSEQEILDLLVWDEYKYVMGNGYGSQQLEDLTIITHTDFIFDIREREYTVNVTGIQNTDGSICEPKPYTAKYGEIFDFSDLSGTGASNDSTDKFTKFKNLTTNCYVETFSVRDGAVVVEYLPIDLSLPINKTMAEAIGSGITATANYQDNFVTAVFTFNGIPHDDVTMKVERGSVLSATKYQQLEAIVSKAALDEFGYTMDITSTSPDVTVPISSATNYILNCSAYTGTRSTIYFMDNYGPEGTPENPDYGMPTITKMEGSYIGPLYNISRRGYTFEGWYVVDHTQFTDGSFTGSELVETLSTVINPDTGEEETITVLTAPSTGVQSGTTTIYGSDGINITQVSEEITWIDSAELTERFTAQKMPKHDVYLYAKWTPNEYKVTFDDSKYDANLAEGADTMYVLYDSTYQEGYVYENGQRVSYVGKYGSLPVPVEPIANGSNKRFVFWYYKDADLNTWLRGDVPNSQIRYEDWVRIDENFNPQVKILGPTTLQPYWKDKVDINPRNHFTFVGNSVIYDRYAYPTMSYAYTGGTIKLDVINGTETIVEAPSENGTLMFYEEIEYPAASTSDPAAGYTIGYRISNAAQDDYTSSAHNVGTYSVHVERPEDHVFNEADTLFSESYDPKLIVNKAHRSETTNSFGTVSVSASNIGYTMAELSVNGSEFSRLDLSTKATYSFMLTDHPEYCQGCEGFIHSLDPNTTYSSLTVRITDDPNYHDSVMTCSGSFTTRSAPDASAKWITSYDTSWFDNSSGTYTISTAEELAGLAYLTSLNGDSSANYFKNKTIELTADIDLTGKWWTPIQSFNGTFNGNGHLISGMYTDHNAESAGLFGNLYGRVENLVIGDAYVYSERTYASIGGVAGSVVAAKVDQCVSYAQVKYKTINDAATPDVGGITGSVLGDEVEKAFIVNCVNYGKVTSDNTHVGGIVGYADANTTNPDSTYVVNCANFGYVEGASRVGGIMGVNDADEDNGNTKVVHYIYNCINVGKVRGGEFTGAIIGRNHLDDGYILHNYYRSGSAYSTAWNTSVGAVGKASDDGLGYIPEGSAQDHYNNCSFDPISLELTRNCGYGTALADALINAKDENGKNYAQYGAKAWERKGPNTYPIPMDSKRYENFLK
ncbi:MAG: S-layer homology domain-containing protein [Ruminococcaceae bacterium]|nr:S-layer homology domain-containing protein [Oscillospiraceae bacterium]